ncbi:AraC family transcriptional regulator [Hoeflea poritis]|uniref:AraC family transcriptional regulator n=1 Tax=Hoeflea poritis TaxID=2993659 RepID=A0ABT4VLT1_9HYPH|nr:AraC family transcriptional regulator [Hoeflea poritis]MDA4845636.1 AraC family transcriptional regulator [Hoeflea poritis]
MGQRNRYEDRVLRVIAYIHDHADTDLSLDTLADVACMSRFHWHRVFRAMTGETVAGAVRRIRLHKASLQLIATDDPVSSIADRFGYPNLASFTRAFTAEKGLSPSAFREKRKSARLELLKSRGSDNMYPVKIEKCPELTIAAVAHKGPYQGLSAAFEKVVRIFFSRGLLDQWAGMVALYHDDSDMVPETELRAHAGVILARPDGFPRDIDGLDIMPVAASRYAIVEHKGPYMTLHDAYQWFFGTWLPASDIELRDAPLVEFYVNNPRDVSPEDLRTDIRIPVV